MRLGNCLVEIRSHGRDQVTVHDFCHPAILAIEDDRNQILPRFRLPINFRFGASLLCMPEHYDLELGHLL